MYAIETELGRFEADTEKAAKQLLRKAEKEHQEKAAERSRNEELAQLRADAQAYRIISAVRKNYIPCSWTPEEITSTYSPVKPQWMDSGADQAYEIETNDGKARKSFLGSIIARQISNASGYCIAVSFRNCYTGREHWHAVGIAGDQLRIAEIDDQTAERLTAQTAEEQTAAA